MIAVIGGSGLSHMPGFSVTQTISADTPYGLASDTIKKGVLHGLPLAFLCRHGADQRLPPHLINYRANLFALKEAGVNAIFSVTAVGGIHSEFETGDLIVPDQLIDYTWGRESTYFDGDRFPRRHLVFTEPFDAEMRRCLIEGGADTSRKLHEFGTYGCTQGPRLETAAEVHRLKTEGVDLVGMTAMPEAALAGELDMAYACLSLVVNPAAGLGAEELTEQEIFEQAEQALPDLCATLHKAVISASEGLLAGGSA